MSREFLTSGQVGNIELDAQKMIKKQIQERWERLGFVEGLAGHVKENVATLYENEAKHLLKEATASDNSGSFETVVFPIIRRVFSKLLANEIVSVQAMNLPIGRLFFMLPVTSERTWVTENNVTTGSHNGLMGYKRENRNKDGAVENRFYLPDDAINDMTTAKVTEYMKTSLYDLFYNDFLYDNSKGKITINVGDAKSVILNKNREFEPVALNVYPVNGTDSTVRSVILEVTGFASHNAGKLTGPDGNEMDTESFLASLKVVTTAEIKSDGFACFEAGEGIHARVVTQRYGSGIVDYNNPCDAKGKMYIEIDLSKPKNNTWDGYIGVDPTKLTDVNLFEIAWAQYDSLELETEMGEVSFKLDAVTVSVEERKLRATWSPELAQDVAAFHNIDAEAELTALLSEQIAAEIDREILRDLRTSAPWQTKWDHNGWKRQAPLSTNYTQKDWNQELINKINQISAQIHKATLKGGASFIVVSSEISAVLDNLEYFHVTDASAEQDQYNMGIERVGSIMGRYQVYRDPYSPSYSLVMGHKGKSLLDTGYVYAPYVPLQLTPTMYNPENFAPVKGILTRYAKKMVNARFYGHIRVDGLTTWNPLELR